MTFVKDKLSVTSIALGPKLAVIRSGQPLDSHLRSIPTFTTFRVHPHSDKWQQLTTSGIPRTTPRTNRSGDRDRKTAEIPAEQPMPVTGVHTKVSLTGDMSYVNYNQRDLVNVESEKISRSYSPRVNIQRRSAALTKPDPRRIKSGFWRTLRPTPGEVDLRKHFLRRSESSKGNGHSKSVNVNEKAGFDDPKVRDQKDAHSNSNIADKKAIQNSSTTLVTSTSNLSKSSDQNHLDKPSDSPNTDQQPEDVDPPVMLQFKESRESNATFRQLYHPSRTAMYIVTDTTRVKSGNQIAPSRSRNNDPSKEMETKHGISKNSYDKFSTVEVRKSEQFSPDRRSHLSDRLKSAQVLDKQRRAQRISRDIRRLQSLLTCQRNQQQSIDAKSTQEPKRMPSSNSMALYNMSLHSSDNTAVAYQRVYLRDKLSVQDDWQLNLSPATWVKLLKANPGDPVLTEISKRAKAGTLSDHIKHIHGKSYQETPTTESVTSTRKLSLRANKPRAASCKGSLEHQKVLSYVDENLYDKSMVQTNKMPLLRSLTSVQREQTPCRVPQNSPEPDYCSGEDEEVDYIVCTVPCSKCSTSLPQLPMRKFRRQSKVSWEQSSQSSSSVSVPMRNVQDATQPANNTDAATSSSKVAQSVRFQLHRKA